MASRSWVSVGRLPLVASLLLAGCAGESAEPPLATQTGNLGETQLASDVVSLQVAGERIFATVQADAWSPLKLVELDVATGQRHPVAITPHSAMFATNGREFAFSGYGIFLQTLDAPAPAELADANPFTAVMIHRDFVYFVAGDSFHRVPIAGGTAQRIPEAVGEALASPFIGQGDYVFAYYRDHALDLGERADGVPNRGHIYQWDVSSPTPRLVANISVERGSDAPRSLAAHGGYAYVVGAEGLLRGPVAQPPFDYQTTRNAELVLPESECERQGAFAVDADGIHVACMVRQAGGTASFELRTYDLAGQSPRVLATGLGDVARLAAVGDDLVGTSSNGDWRSSKVFRVAKR